MSIPATTPAGAVPRRRPRDWVVDSLMFLFALVFGLVSVAGQEQAPASDPSWVLTIDLIAGLLGAAGLWLRRRWPVGLALVLVALSTFSEAVAGAMIMGLLTVAIHRPPRTTAVVFALSVLAALVYVLLRPERATPWFLLFLLGVTIQGAAVGWGLFIHFRRQLVESLRDRAVRAETEAQLRAEQAQQRARDEIAREMHDVLGHRLSLLSVHAGALEFRPDAPAEEVARAAKVIRENAHQALQDLREVIGVLRAPVGELPQPTLADVAQLVAESGRAGMRVTLRDETSAAAPDLIGRTAYRVVQEALTNARKHAPDAEVLVHMTGSPGTGLTVEVLNQPVTTPPETDPAIDPRPAPNPPELALKTPRPAPNPPGPVAETPGPAPNPPAAVASPPVGERSRSPDGSAGPHPQPPSGQEPDPQLRAGLGLGGLAERVALASGRLEHGPTAGGGWRVAAWLPWPA
jgi:signal transduction histidine kinase